jgi:hypothetical protein
MNMASAQQEQPTYLLRQRSLGSEAVYKVLDEHDGIVTASVMHAPGLECGSHVRLMARAAGAMQRLDLAGMPVMTPRHFDPIAASFGSMRPGRSQRFARGLIHH